MYEFNSREIPLNSSYDVIVIGGGPAGCAAATSAAREGAKTLLIEASGMLGGMATKGLVEAWTPYSDGIRIIYGGLSRRAMEESIFAIVSGPMLIPTAPAIPHIYITLSPYSLCGIPDFVHKPIQSGQK